MCGNLNIRLEMEGLRINESIVFKYTHVPAMHFYVDKERRLKVEKALS